MTDKNIHSGSNLDDLLEEDGLLEESTAVAIKRVLAWQLSKTMKDQKISKTVMSSKMQTSRASLNRLLDGSDKV